MNILTKSERELLEEILRDRFDNPTDVWGEEQAQILSISEKLTEAGIITEKHTKEMRGDSEFIEIE